ncbi:MAG: alpha-amylase family glycosyl hydrolase, partial [Anaerolineae bacterium]|nr:alpha-amylase family glycosyl hydrolase [Anaerolineae bacterium]
MPKDWLTQQAERTLSRLLPRLDVVLPVSSQALFYDRLRQHFPRVFRLLYAVYGQQYDFFYHVEQILLTTARLYSERPADLHALDLRREAEPQWFQSEKMVGAVCYVDLFAGTLAGLRDKIPYLKALNITYLHLMPLFKVPERNNDGGYAVSDYRTVNPSVGTMAELADLAQALRAEGISLVLDMVFNHTSDE